MSRYSHGLEVLGSPVVPVPVKTTERGRALHGIGSLGGGLLGAYLWPKHYIIGFLLGSSLGWNTATLITGEDPL